MLVVTNRGTAEVSLAVDLTAFSELPAQVYVVSGHETGLTGLKACATPLTVSESESIAARRQQARDILSICVIARRACLDVGAGTR
jgi:hypothetical protein